MCRIDVCVHFTSLFETTQKKVGVAVGEDGEVVASMKPRLELAGRNEAIQWNTEMVREAKDKNTAAKFSKIESDQNETFDICRNHVELTEQAEDWDSEYRISNNCRGLEEDRKDG